MSRGRPKKLKTTIDLWVVEQYFSGDRLTQSWGKPIKVCYSESSAKETMELEAISYAESIECPEIDRSLDRMITIRSNNGENSFYPYMDFWYYHSLLVEED